LYGFSEYGGKCILTGFADRNDIRINAWSDAKGSRNAELDVNKMDVNNIVSAEKQKKLFTIFAKSEASLQV
jgi:hypothetical protein